MVDHFCLPILMIEIVVNVILTASNSDSKNYSGLAALDQQL
jgi:hypothetical protein